MKKLLAILMCAIMLTACSTDYGTATTAADTTGASTTAATADTSAADTTGADTTVAASSASGKTVSILTPYLSSVTTKQMCDSLQAGLESNGIQVQVVDTKNDFAALASRIEDVVAAKTDAIVIVSADPGQVETQLNEAIAAGIPVFGCDSGYIDGMMVNATSDNYKMGQDMCKYLMDDVMGGKGTIIALTYRPHPGIIKRCQALDEALAAHPDIKLITEQQVDVPAGPIESSRKIMEDLMLTNSDPDSITAVWCAWDEPAIGATQALQAAGRTDVVVTGVDGNSQAVEMINQGTNLVATMSQNFDGMAQIVTDDIVDLFDGKDIETGEKYAPASLITKE